MVAYPSVCEHTAHCLAYHCIVAHVVLTRKVNTTWANSDPDVRLQTSVLGGCTADHLTCEH